MDTKTPVIFADGTKFFDELSKVYTRHGQGFFVLAPSGAGKTFYVNSQKVKHWIDGDTLWPAANADMSDGGWAGSFDTVMDINNKSDVITNEAKKLGFWVIGSSNNYLKPDAIVLPKWNTHKRYIAHREQSSYDGGATTNDHKGVKSHRARIRKWKRCGVPCFESVKDAAEYLATSQIRDL